VRNVGLYMFDGVEELDWAGPWEVLAAYAQGWDDSDATVFTVAAKDEPITCSLGLRVLPDYTWETAPPLDVLVVPGGPGTRALLNDEEALAWVALQAKRGALVASVCTGAGVLAAAGLLTDREATTYFESFDWLAEIDPTIKLRPGQRVVDSGDIVTSAGISAAIDLGLHVVARMHSPERAAELARVIEYTYEGTA
jgi:transcriptional regulator GlxA family with amidase domain